MGPLCQLKTLLTELLAKMAWEDKSLRDIAGYFIGVEFSSASSGRVRYWDRSIYSHELRGRLFLDRIERDYVGWGEWDYSID
jgi:hypothetical protein